MNKLTISGNNYTAKQLAAQFGCSVDTILNHANKLFGPGTPRKARCFDEAQTTAILEHIKITQSQGGRRKSADCAIGRLNENLQSTETAMSDEFRLAMLYKQEAAILKQANEIEHKLMLKHKDRADIAERKLAETEYILKNRTDGTYQRIAEHAGLVLTDRDDLYSAYRGRYQYD